MSPKAEDIFEIWLSPLSYVLENDKVFLIYIMSK